MQTQNSCEMSVPSYQTSIDPYESQFDMLMKTTGTSAVLHKQNHRVLLLMFEVLMWSHEAITKPQEKLHRRPQITDAVTNMSSMGQFRYLRINLNLIPTGKTWQGHESLSMRVRLAHTNFRSNNWSGWSLVRRRLRRHLVIMSFDKTDIMAVRAVSLRHIFRACTLHFQATYT